MKLINILLLSSITSSLIANTSLIDYAKKAGLKPIPTDKKELNKIIDPKKVITPQRVELGKRLYFDPRVSKSGLISCNWCHNLGLGGVDGVPKAIGHKWSPNPHYLNSPTVYNAVFFKRQFWNGRSDSLEDQAQGPIQAGVEMAMDHKLLAERINSIPEYVNEFKKAYDKNTKIDLKTIASAIATFERTLVTPSRYDDFLNGDEKALNRQEQKGLKTFIDKGCVTCHNDIALGGSMKPFELNEKYKFRDVGDFVANNKLVKVPTLRNITETAPYFHNGQIWDLRKAIKEMGNVQVGYKVNGAKQDNSLSVKIMPISLTEKDVDNILAFFKSLKGKKPIIIYPQLPESSINTPKPITDSK
ncbi:Cytochrome c551 peroxidase [hydrothermal vent metagenome]|uniref:Cytochrome c551 peroxidase n=1 Tax=hydrothermal vent metagenome TaxID=652676 RepID=A0A1W1CDV0_9ZZZZ